MQQNKIEIEKTVEYMRYVKDEIIVKATKRAIIRAVKTGSKTVSLAVRKDGYKVKSSRVKTTLKSDFSNMQSKNISEIGGQLIVPHVPMSLGYFNPKSVRLVVKSKNGNSLYRTGYSVQVKGRRKLVKGAFMMKTKSGEHLYQRTGKGRTPFRKLFTTSIRDVVSNDPVIEFIRSASVRMFEKTFNEALRYLVSKSR